MPINRKLLDILVCPITKLPVSVVNEDKLKRLNRLVSEGELQTMDGKTITEPIQEALITSNRNMIYRIESNIPVMLEDQAISTDQIEGW